MSETTVTPPATDPGSDPGSGFAAPSVPEGFVPVGEVENAREEARRRYQSENDRLKAEVDRLKAAAPKPAASDEGKAGDFDPDAFRASLLSEVFGASQLANAVAELKGKFPHADPELFTPERLATFGNADALRFAAEDSHKRVAAILDAERSAIEAKLREELAAGAAGTLDPTGMGGTPPGDPTPEQLAGMSLREMDALEARSPGVIDRVLGRAA